MATTKIEASNIATGAVPSTGLTSVQVITATSTWTKPADITKIIVEVQGAGGAGCKSQTNTTKATSGGGGGYAKKFLDVTNTTKATATIGSGGAAQTTNDTAGAAGGLSKFEEHTGSGGWTDVIGNGGNGGTFTAYGMVLGGTATGGDVNIPGGTGTGGGMGEYGGDSMLGRAGGIMWTGQLTSNIATGYGSGGGGSYQLTSGAGMNGIIIVWEYK